MGLGLFLAHGPGKPCFTDFSLLVPRDALNQTGLLFPTHPGSKPGYLRFYYIFKPPGDLIKVQILGQQVWVVGEGD